MMSRRYLSGRRFRRASESGNFGQSPRSSVGMPSPLPSSSARTSSDLCLFQGELMHGHAWTPSSEEDELPRNCLFDPKFWSVRSDSVQDTNRQIFASRFAANDPLRTCDMQQTLDAFLHYAFLIYCSPPTVRHEPWMPIRVPHQ